MGTDYVHGYSAGKQARLHDQATTLTALLHADTRYPAGSRVLEAGCGWRADGHPGLAQPAGLVHLDRHLGRFPRQARDRARRAGHPQVTFQQADLYRLPYGPGSFDHVFVCFVLEHLRDPVSALAELGRVLRPGGTLSVIEGDHGSAYFHPDNDQAGGPSSA